MQQELQKLQADFGKKCVVEIYGQSERNRPLYALRIGDDSLENHILFQGAIHGREYITTQLLMVQSRKWLEASIQESVCLHILPMCNPDGVCISQQNQRRWKANARGVDLNRNFPAGWKTLHGAPFPGAWGYKGPFPCSEPESAALALYTLRYPIRATVSYHASGSVIYWEYGQKQMVNVLSQKLARAIGQITGYPLANAKGLEAGGYKDWVIDALQIPSITIEVGHGKAPLPDTKFTEIYRRNQDVLKTVAHWLLHMPM